MKEYLDSNKELIEAWLQNLTTVKRKSSHTIINYQGCLNQFCQFINKSLLEANENDFEDYIANKNWSIATQNTKQGTLMSFYAWATRKGHIEKNPYREGLDLAKPKKLVEHLSKDQIEICNNYLLLGKVTASKERDYVMFNFMIGTGLRISEVLDVKIKDLVFWQKYGTCTGEVMVHDGKGDKPRLVPFWTDISDLLRSYIKKYKLVDSDGYLFANKLGNRMGSSYPTRIFDRIKKATGINVHPHITRHTYATMAITNKMNIQDLQAILGHTDIKTTQIYFDQSPELTRAAVENCGPRLGQLVLMI